MQQKVEPGQPVVQGGHPQGAPNVSEFITYQPYTQQSWLTWVSSFGKRKGNPWHLGFCNSGHGFHGSSLREVEGRQ